MRPDAVATQNVWEIHRTAGFPPPEFDANGDIIPPEQVAKRRRRAAARARRERKGQAVSSAVSKRVRDQVLARDGLDCRYCGRALRRQAGSGDPLRVTLDHIVPRSDGGGNGPDNLVVCCQTCNSAKGNDRLGSARCRGVLMALRPPPGQVALSGKGHDPSCPLRWMQQPPDAETCPRCAPKG